MQCYLACDFGHGGEDKQAYVLNNVSGNGNNCLLRCMMETFGELNLCWATVAAGVDERVKVLVDKAGIRAHSDQQATKWGKELAKAQDAAAAICIGLAADGDVLSLRKLLVVLLRLLRYGAKQADKYEGQEYNVASYGSADIIDHEVTDVSKDKLIGWQDSIPVLTDFLFPKGTVLLVYSRLYPGAQGAFHHDHLNKRAIHYLNPSTQRLLKANLENCHVVGGDYRVGFADIEGLADAHRFVHCVYGDEYGLNNNGCVQNNHYVTIEPVGNIDDETPLELATKWTRNMLNTAQPNRNRAALDGVVQPEVTG
jgi:hypothetical protein